MPIAFRSLLSILALLGLLWTLALLGCANPATQDGDSALRRAFRQVLADAVANPGRPEADRADDANRKPAEVLEALGIRPGMRVLDLLAGGGYYSEILSSAVGDDGSVLFHNNQAYLDFLGADKIAERTAGGRLRNVESLASELSDLGLEEGELDAIIFILGFHDLYLVVDDGSWPIIDQPKLMRALFDGLRPSGILGIVDHSAIADTDPYEGAKGPHRIDEAFVRTVVEDAGFVFESDSDVLRHPEDDRLTPVFDESIRRRTDRFILRYRKPR